MVGTAQQPWEQPRTETELLRLQDELHAASPLSDNDLELMPAGVLTSSPAGGGKLMQAPLPPAEPVATQRRWAVHWELGGRRREEARRTRDDSTVYG